jgi:hypothetical protein
MSTLKTTNIQHPSATSPNIELDSDGGINFFFSAAPQDGQVLTYNATDGKWEAKDLKMKEKRIAAFTGSGTWTVPAGITYAIGYITGGGGGLGNASAGAGGASSIAFASGTITANGGAAKNTGGQNLVAGGGGAGAANSGSGATYIGNTNATFAVGGAPSDGARIVAAATVTPAASISITVGAGGVAGSGNGVAGGSGYVYIEYYEEV